MLVNEKVSYNKTLKGIKIVEREEKRVGVYSNFQFKKMINNRICGNFFKIYCRVSFLILIILLMLK